MKRHHRLRRTSGTRDPAVIRATAWACAVLIAISLVGRVIFPRAQTIWLVLFVLGIAGASSVLPAAIQRIIAAWRDRR